MLQSLLCQNVHVCPLECLLHVPALVGSLSIVLWQHSLTGLYRAGLKICSVLL